VRLDSGTRGSTEIISNRERERERERERGREREGASEEEASTNSGVPLEQIVVLFASSKQRCSA